MAIVSPTLLLPEEMRGEKSPRRFSSNSVRGKRGGKLLGPPSDFLLLPEEGKEKKRKDPARRCVIDGPQQKTPSPASTSTEGRKESGETSVCRTIRKGFDKTFLFAPPGKGGKGSRRDLRGGGGAIWAALVIPLFLVCSRKERSPSISSCSKGAAGLGGDLLLGLHSIPKGKGPRSARKSKNGGSSSPPNEREGGGELEGKSTPRS